MSTYRTIGEVEEGYLRDHPDELDDYITDHFDEYAESCDTAFLFIIRAYRKPVKTGK